MPGRTRTRVVPPPVRRPFVGRIASVPARRVLHEPLQRVAVRIELQLRRGDLRLELPRSRRRWTLVQTPPAVRQRKSSPGERLAV